MLFGRSSWQTCTAISPAILGSPPTQRFLHGRGQAGVAYRPASAANTGGRVGCYLGMVRHWRPRTGCYFRMSYSTITPSVNNEQRGRSLSSDNLKYMTASFENLRRRATYNLVDNSVDSSKEQTKEFVYPDSVFPIYLLAI